MAEEEDLKELRSETKLTFVLGSSQQSQGPERTRILAHNLTEQTAFVKH